MDSATTALPAIPTTSTTATISPSRRLPHLDGLRTLALCGVLLFHFDVPLFSGGFVGVDIFFTLSGFLITRNILHSLLSQSNSSTFSLPKFYTRRFFRLFPASCLTILCTLLAAMLVITPDRAQAIYGSGVASLTLWSNIFFHREGSYFDETFEMRPLLHFWSLSVEEQFYVIWPPLILCLFFVANGRINQQLFLKLGTHVLIALSALSFGFASYVHLSSPSWAFYELPSRVFQFGVGAVLAFREASAIASGVSDNLTAGLLSAAKAEKDVGKLPSYQSISPPSSLPPISVITSDNTADNMSDSASDTDSLGSDPDIDNVNDAHDLISLLSLGVILVSFALLPQNSAPLRYLPTNLATALLILYPESIVCQICFFDPRVALVGRASYSIYLVHWPIAILCRHLFDATRIPSGLHTPILLPISILLGFKLYQSVETPFRTSYLRSPLRAAFVVLLGFGTLAFAIYGQSTRGIASLFPERGLTGWKSGIAPRIHPAYWRISNDVTKQYPGNHPNIHVRRVGDFSSPIVSKYVFFGDSFTEHLTGALHNIGNDAGIQFQMHYAYHCGFRATSSLATWTGQASGYRCADTLPILWRHIDALPNSTVIVVANWWCSPVGLFSKLKELKEELATHGKELAVFTEPPGINEKYRFYYPCADLRVLPLGRFISWVTGQPFTGGRDCLPSNVDLPPEWQTAKQRKDYKLARENLLGEHQLLDIFKYLCTGDDEGETFKCSLPANLSGLVYDIGYKHDLDHLSYVGSDYVTKWVRRELYPNGTVL